MRFGLYLRSRRVGLLLASIVAAGFVGATNPGSASANYSWGPGWLPISYNANCVFYYGQANCSYFSTGWIQITAGNHVDSIAAIHLGFESYNAIRGHYLNPNTGTSFNITAGFASGTNVEGEVTCAPYSNMGQCSNSYSAYVDYSITN